MTAAQKAQAIAILTREVDTRKRRAGERQHEANMNPHCEDWAAMLLMEAAALQATLDLVTHYTPAAPAPEAGAAT